MGHTHARSGEKVAACRARENNSLGTHRHNSSKGLALRVIDWPHSPPSITGVKIRDEDHITCFELHTRQPAGDGRAGQRLALLAEAFLSSHCTTHRQ